MGIKNKELYESIYWIAVSGLASMFVTVLLVFMFAGYVSSTTALSTLGIIVVKGIGFFGSVSLALYLFSAICTHFEGIGFIKTGRSRIKP